MVKRGAKSNYNSLLVLWRDNPKQQLPFNQIVQEAQQKWGYRKRTIINYLNQLVGEKILEKIVDINRNTFYKIAETPKALSSLYKEVLKQTIEGIEDEAYLGILTAFILQLEIERLNTKSLPEAIKNAGLKVAELWQTFQSFDKALETLKRKGVKA